MGCDETVDVEGIKLEDPSFDVLHSDSKTSDSPAAASSVGRAVGGADEAFRPQGFRAFKQN